MNSFDETKSCDGTPSLTKDPGGGSDVRELSQLILEKLLDTKPLRRVDLETLWVAIKDWPYQFRIVPWRPNHDLTDPKAGAVYPMFTQVVFRVETSDPNLVHEIALEQVQSNGSLLASWPVAAPRFQIPTLAFVDQSPAFPGLWVATITSGFLAARVGAYNARYWVDGVQVDLNPFSVG